MSYLTCGVPKEVTDVRDDFTERQTLRSKPVKTAKKTKNIFNLDILQIPYQQMDDVALTRLKLK